MNSSKRIKRKVRNAYAISTVSIALVLFLLGAVGYLILGALNASDRLKESVSVYVMLDQKAAPDTVATIGKQLQALESVKEVRFISKDQAAASRIDGLLSVLPGVSDTLLHKGFIDYSLLLSG